MAKVELRKLLCLCTILLCEMFISLKVACITGLKDYVKREKNHGTPAGRSCSCFCVFAPEADSSYITGEGLTLLGGETTAACGDVEKHLGQDSQYSVKLKPCGRSSMS
ncbi:MAG TPA: hypothetical protein VFP11_05980 [Candidatus Angelobacter sp.]|nr:hypothetical protein [Candidatus Angelobacter sp.]